MTKDEIQQLERFCRSKKSAEHLVDFVEALIIKYKYEHEQETPNHSHQEINPTGWTELTVEASPLSIYAIWWHYGGYKYHVWYGKLRLGIASTLLGAKHIIRQHKRMRKLNKRLGN